MNKNIFKKIFFWILAHATIWTVFFKFITNTSFWLALIYFSFWNIVVLYFFKDVFKNLIAQTKKRDIVWIVIIFCVHGLTYWVCHQFLTAPVELMKTSTASFIQVDAYFIWIKPLDALLQQLMIIILITKLHQNKIQIKTIALLLGVVFGVAHIMSAERIDISVVIVMTFFTTAFALIMPYLLLKVRNGYIYNFMIHLTLVDLAALMYWGMFG